MVCYNVYQYYGEYQKNCEINLIKRNFFEKMFGINDNYGNKFHRQGKGMPISENREMPVVDEDD